MPHSVAGCCAQHRSSARTACRCARTSADARRERAPAATWRTPAPPRRSPWRSRPACSLARPVDLVGDVAVAAVEQRSAQRAEHHRDFAVLIGVIEVRQPVLRGEARSSGCPKPPCTARRSCAWSLSAFFENVERARDAPGLVVLAIVEVQLVQRVDTSRASVGSCASRYSYSATASPNLVGQLAVELRQDLVLVWSSGFSVAGHLERLRRRLDLLQAVAIDHAEVVPQVELQLLVGIGRAPSSDAASCGRRARGSSSPSSA